MNNVRIKRAIEPAITRLKQYYQKIKYSIFLTSLIEDQNLNPTSKLQTPNPSKQNFGVHSLHLEPQNTHMYFRRDILLLQHPVHVQSPRDALPVTN